MVAQALALAGGDHPVGIGRVPAHGNMIDADKLRYPVGQVGRWHIKSEFLNESQEVPPPSLSQLLGVSAATRTKVGESAASIAMRARGYRSR